MFDLSGEEGRKIFVKMTKCDLEAKKFGTYKFEKLQKRKNDANKPSKICILKWRKEADF